MRYDRSQEVVTVDPVLAEMIKYMDLDTNEVPEETAKSCNDKRFFDDYLSENRPVVLRGYSKDWIAMNKWSDLDYFKDKARGTQVRLYTIKTNMNATKGEVGKFSEANGSPKGGLVKIEKAVYGSEH